MPETTPAHDLDRVLAAIRRHWLAAAAVLAVTLLATGAASRLGRPHYQATAQILIQLPDQVNGVLNPDGATSPANAQRDVTTNAQLITSVPVADAVRHQLGLTESAKQLIARLSVTGQTTSNLVEITARDTRPDRAARIATAVATQYQAYRRQSAQDAIGSAISAASTRLQGMDTTAQASAEGQALATRLHQLQTAQAVATGGVQLVRPAAVPTAPAPRLSPLMAGIALILGLALAAVAVAVLERLDHRLLDEGAIRDGLDLPVIARVPAAGGGRRRRDRVEALDALAARLRFVPPGKKAQVLMVAPVAEYSAEDLAIELADALAGFESWVMLVDADLARRRPDRDVIDDGLTGVLTGSRRLEDALVPVFVRGEDDGRRRGAWHLLPAGRGAARPMSLLASGEMRQVVATARENADVVVILAPPLTHGGEALAIAALADELVVVARPRWTAHADADRAREVLGATLTPVAGVVIESARRRLGPGARVDRAPLMLAEQQPSGQAPHPFTASA
ncbi:MAG TPA: Wzz/FepE/Etk N-terminal domain-containing protein [Solirubrobacteraceae bacterium]